MFSLKVFSIQDIPFSDMNPKKVGKNLTSKSQMPFHFYSVDESWDTVPEVRKETTATSAGLDSKETPKAGVDPPQEDEKESLNVKETPNRTQSETDVDTNNKTDVIVDNSVKSSSQSTSQTSLKEEEEVTVMEVAETDLTDGVKELTLEPENIQEERKEDRSPTESSNGSSGNKGKPNPPTPPTSFTQKIKNLEWIEVLIKVNLSQAPLLSPPYLHLHVV